METHLMNVSLDFFSILPSTIRRPSSRLPRAPVVACRSKSQASPSSIAQNTDRGLGSPENPTFQIRDPGLQRSASITRLWPPV